MQALARRGEQRVAEARARLSAEQIIFAEWLALPYSERSPKTQKELAKQLGFNEHTLGEWKQIPELWHVRDSLINSIGKELVSEAMSVLRKALTSDNKKLATEVARDILDRWAEPTKHANLILTVKDLYAEYH